MKKILFYALLSLLMHPTITYSAAGEIKEEKSSLPVSYHGPAMHFHTLRSIPKSDVYFQVNGRYRSKPETKVVFKLTIPLEAALRGIGFEIPSELEYLSNLSLSFLNSGSPTLKKCSIAAESGISFSTTVFNSTTEAIHPFIQISTAVEGRVTTLSVNTMTEEKKRNLPRNAPAWPGEDQRFPKELSFSVSEVR